MQDYMAAAVLIVTTLLMYQILVGKTLATDFSVVSRNFDPVGFWSSLLQQCVAIAVTAVVTMAICKTDWKKVYEATRPRRRG